jgi:hypothetical protein
MRYRVTAARDLKSMLCDLVPLIRDAQRQLHVGREIGNFAQRPREVLGTWLICAALNYQSGAPETWTFSTDPDGGDGLIILRAEGRGERIEHVFVREVPAGQTLEDAIVAAATAKQKKGGAAYAEGKHLAVLCDAGGETAWYPNRVGRALHDAHDFESVWAVGLHEADDENHYTYWVTQFDSEVSPVVRVSIDLSTCEWHVDTVQERR